MLRFVITRVLMVVPTFIGVTLAAFAFIRLIPGDPIELLVGERGIDPARHARLLHEMGFDRPLWEQYFGFLGEILSGNLGKSIVTKQPVLEEFLTLFPATIELSVCALTVALLIGLPAGIFAAVRRGSAFDHSVMAASLTGFSMPIYWSGLMMIILFSGILHWTPVSGRISALFWVDPVTGFLLIDSLLSDEEGTFVSAVRHLILPSLVLATIPLAVIARQTRSAMLEVLSEDYVRTARAKGLSPFRVIGLHALRNALIPVVTVIGLQVGALLAGAILTETIFSWPGVGKWLVDSIFRRDYPSVQSGLLLIASVVMVVNLIVDLLYGLINPRIRHAR
ncbi:MAG: ABC transporter permease subunit [Proteobacteria bacterium]|nr:ABC transporter permease subunit [Pseudomonadota bacterium]MCH9011735.1 ABC transporter permease subunit [Pseudomonadota bacterium]